MTNDQRLQDALKKQQEAENTVISYQQKIDNLVAAVKKDRDNLVQKLHAAEEKVLFMQNANSSNINNNNASINNNNKELLDKIKSLEEKLNSKDQEISQLKKNFRNNQQTTSFDIFVVKS